MMQETGLGQHHYCTVQSEALEVLLDDICHSCPLLSIFNSPLPPHYHHHHHFFQEQPSSIFILTRPLPDECRVIPLSSAAAVSLSHTVSPLVARDLREVEVGLGSVLVDHPPDGFSCYLKGCSLTFARLHNCTHIYQLYSIHKLQ
jgi:hypothetical protein